MELKKPINLKKECKAVALYRKAEREYDFAREYAPGRVDSTRDAYDAARKEAEATLTRLADALDIVQHRCTARTIDAMRIVRDIVRIEEKLGLSKKLLEDTEIRSRDLNARSFPKAYSFTPESTKYNAIYKSGCWKITHITRGACGTKAGEIRLTDEAKAAFITHAIDGIL